MAFKTSSTQLTAAARTNDVWLYVPDTSKPIESISAHVGVEKFPKIALCSDYKPGDAR